jgi:hypothetical protein
MPPLHLPSELGLLEKYVEQVAPRVSVMPEVAARFRRAFARVLTLAMASPDMRMKDAPPGSSPRARVAIATLSSVASAEGLDPDDLPAIRAWLRRWIDALGMDTAINDEQLHYRLATLAPSVRSGARTACDVLVAPFDEQRAELFDGLVYGQEALYAPPAPIATYKAVSANPAIGGGRWLPPEQSVGYEERLRLMHEKGGSRALAARYTVEFLRLDPQILQPEPSVEPKGETDDSRTKKRPRDASLAA